MGKSDAASTKADLKALDALQADASELEQIENLLDRFNVFETIGFVKQELMHSRFLAFLLDPKENHGLDDIILRSFLRKVSESTDRVSLPQAFDSSDDGGLGQTTVHTEVHTGDGRIDILLLNEIGKWAMIVENKIRSAEHSDQLDKYYRFVRKAYPNLQPLGIYLTPYGAAPERRQDREKYQPFSYGTICRVLDGVLEDQGSTLKSDLRVAVEHYTDMVRRNVVKDAEVSRLSREIYRKHHRAINRIIVDLDATLTAIHRLVRSLIQDAPQLDYGYRETEMPQDYIVFDHRDWDVPALNVGERYHGSDRLLYFVFYSDLSESLEVWLELGPGDTTTRNRLLNMARENPSTFVEEPYTPEEGASLFKRPLLTGDLLDTLSSEEREQEVRRQWNEFLEQDLPRIEAALNEEAWIWDR